MLATTLILAQCLMTSGISSTEPQLCSGLPASNSLQREGLSLNGEWKMVVDPYENGFFNYRWEPFDQQESPDKQSYFLDLKPTDRSDRIEYDFDKAENINVPGDWNTQHEKLYFYEGSVWYRKSFECTPPEGMRAFVVFGAANYETHAYLNGRKLGSHVGGFTPFQFEITDFLREGAQSLVVKVDNKRLREGVPTLNTDWWNYGGLTRDVRVFFVPQSFIHSYGLSLKPGTRDTVILDAWIDNAVTDKKLKLVIPEMGIDQEFEADEHGHVVAEAQARRIYMWSTTSPKLYDVALAYGDDHLTDQIGFRTITTEGQDILLNGRPVFLKGISIHEESPLSQARAYSREDAEALLSAAKELGCNMVRLAHYPHNEHMARVADELGIMVWEEIPVYWTIQWDNPATLSNARNQLRELIHRDRNRASVIIWSMANETPVSESRNEFLLKLVEDTRAADPTRLISAAMEFHRDPDDANRLIVEDPFAEHTDLVSFNQYVGWYHGMPEDCANIEWHIPYDKPVFISEFGGGAKFGLHGDRFDRWTEEFQQELYIKTLPMLDKIAGLRGMSPWILFDFRSPRRPLPEVQDFYNRKGLLSEKGEKKLAWYVLKDYYTNIDRKWRNR